jgi:YHS domain-containing protein
MDSSSPLIAAHRRDCTCRPAAVAGVRSEPLMHQQHSSDAPMTQTPEIIERYHQAFYGGDAATARQYLADEFSFEGPAGTIHGPDAFLRASAHVGRGVKSTERRKVFVDGDDVCLVYDLVVEQPAVRVSVAEWFCLRDARIVSIRMMFDTAAFTRPTKGPSADTSRDPVCHMTVSKAAAAATRTHAGVTYYFCNPGCAELFEGDPEKYLTPPASSK